MSKVDLVRRSKPAPQRARPPNYSDTDTEADDDDDEERIGDYGLVLDAEDSSDSETKPVRSLDLFAVHSWEHNNPVDFMELYECRNLKRSQYYVTGLVNTVLVEGEHDDRDKPIRIRLTQLKDVDVHDFDDTDYNKRVSISGSIDAPFN
jgi:hypothetical protein